MAFLLHFKTDGTILKMYILPDLMCYSPTLISHFHKLEKCFLSNGINNMHILASGPELQAIRFGYVISGKSF
jgi:hypothetical protein